MSKAIQQNPPSSQSLPQSVPQLLTSIAAFTLLYGALAVVEIGLILRAIKKGPFAQHDPVPDGEPAEPEPAVA